MESGAKGCEVIVSGKLRAQRAKAMKFKDGYMISSGQPVNDFIDSAVRHVLLRQGVLGIKVRITLKSFLPMHSHGPICLCAFTMVGGSSCVLWSGSCSVWHFIMCWVDWGAEEEPCTLTMLGVLHLLCCCNGLWLWSERLGVLRRLQVRIMKDTDPSGKSGPKTPMPDVVTVHTPKEEETFQDKGMKDKEGYVKQDLAAPASLPPQQMQQAPVPQPGLA